MSVYFPDADATEADDRDPDILRVVGGNPTEEEIAAVAAVMAAVFDAGIHADRPRDLPRYRSKWELSQRVMRGGQPLDPFSDAFGR